MMKLCQLEPKGKVHLYVGDGKGKTTAAVGLAVRFAGSGGKVLFCQFLKGQDSGEIASLEKLGVEVLRAETCGKFVFQMDDKQRVQTMESHKTCLQQAVCRCVQGGIGLLVLDEVIDAVNTGMLDLEMLLETLEKVNGLAEVVLTGRNPASEITAAADYYTEFQCISHPYQKGVEARKGIEY